jgi:ATP-dependent Zn protease
VDFIFKNTMDILAKNRDVIEKFAKLILKKETLDEYELLELTKEMYRLEEGIR